MSFICHSHTLVNHHTNRSRGVIRTAAIDDSLGDTNDNQSVTSSSCYVNGVPADEEKYPVTELKKEMKEGVEPYSAPSIQVRNHCVRHEHCESVIHRQFGHPTY